MSAGTTSACEASSYHDATTGVEVRQLTAYKGHSHHLYFTNPGWYDGGARLVFISDRANQTNLHSLDLASGEITQLTDLAQDEDTTVLLESSVNPTRSELYFWHGDGLKALDLATFAVRLLWTKPAGYLTTMTNVTADGRYVCLSLFEDLSDRFEVDLLHGYVGFHETWEAHPHSQIVRVDTCSGAAEVVFEEQSWIGHINTSPLLPDVLTFCHEGPWNCVDNRIWGLDLSSGRHWPIRQRRTAEEMIGHEYWMADGLHIGYHGMTADGPVFGTALWDDSEVTERPMARHSTHFSSLDENLVVGDGTPGDPWLYLWQRAGDTYGQPRRLCRHRGSFHTQDLHVHPRFSPDGRQVLFTSDHTGYGQIYLATVPEYAALAEL